MSGAKQSPPVRDRAAEPPLVDACRAALVRLIGTDAFDHDRFGIAVSGGPDSMALIDVMHALTPGRSAGVTVNHGMRAEAADECRLVADWHRAQGIAHTILTIDSPPPPANRQAWARSHRYAALEQWRAAHGADWLLTAHHADDQAETVLLRLARGSGVAGLSGVRRRQGRVLRPFLDVPRVTLSRYLAARGIPFVDDASNRDLRYDRAAVRQRLAALDLDPRRLVRTADTMADADSALDWAAEQRRATWPQSPHPLLQLAGEPPEIARRLVKSALADAGRTATIDGPRWDRLWHQLRLGQQAMIGDALLIPLATGNAVSQWRIEAAPPRSVRDRY